MFILPNSAFPKSNCQWSSSLPPMKYLLTYHVMQHRFEKTWFENTLPLYGALSAKRTRCLRAPYPTGYCRPYVFILRWGPKLSRCAWQYERFWSRDVATHANHILTEPNLGHCRDTEKSIWPSRLHYSCKSFCPKNIIIVCNFLDVDP